MAAILTIIVIIVFVLGSYYGGNAIMGTFKCNAEDRFMSSLIGVIMWIGIICLSICFFGIYQLISCLIK
jgi:hypothetical protein